MITPNELKAIAEKNEFSGYDRTDSVAVVRKLLAEIERLRKLYAGMYLKYKYREKD